MKNKNTEKQKKFRERKAALGLHEIRGIYAKRSNHKIIKEKMKIEIEILENEKEKKE